MKAQTKTPKNDVIGRVQRSYPRLRRILVPLDFSGKSRQALGFAVPLAAKFGARLVMLHVLDGKGERDNGKATLPADSPKRTAAHKRLRETALHYAEPELIEQTIVRTGRPAQEILAAARLLDADLLSITTPGQGGLNRLIKGSTAAQLLRLAPCPVLTVRKK